MSFLIQLYYFSLPSMYYDPFFAAAAANADPSYRLQVRNRLVLPGVSFRTWNLLLIEAGDVSALPINICIKLKFLIRIASESY